MTTTLYTPVPITSFTSNGYTITQAGTAVPDNLVTAIISAAYQADGITLTTSAGGIALVQVPSYYNSGTGAPSSDSLPAGAEVKDSTGAVFEKRSDGTWVAALNGAYALATDVTANTTKIAGSIGVVVYSGSWPSRPSGYGLVQWVGPTGTPPTVGGSGMAENDLFVGV